MTLHFSNAKDLVAATCAEMILYGSHTRVEPVSYPREFLIGFMVGFQADYQELLQEFLVPLRAVRAFGDHPSHTLLRHEGRVALAEAIHRDPQAVFTHLMGHPYKRRNCWDFLLEEEHEPPPR